MSRALDDAAADDNVRVLILRGAGRAFCAGYDIGWGAELMQEAEAGGPWAPMRLWRSPRPVIAPHGWRSSRPTRRR
jgi:enoyl-CoA hydratase